MVGEGRSTTLHCHVRNEVDGTLENPLMNWNDFTLCDMCEMDDHGLSILWMSRQYRKAIS